MNVTGLPHGVRLACITVFAAIGCTTTGQTLQNDRIAVISDRNEVTDDSAERDKPVAAPAPAPAPVAEVAFDRGVASWYGPGFHGRKTANGEVYNQNELTAAHKTLPFNTLVRVENVANGKSVVVRINDRGPFVGNRIIDLSQKAARNISMIGSGTAEVRLTVINPDPDYDRKTYLSEQFTLQLGSFSKPEHAQSIAKDLNGSRVAEAKVQNRVYYRVYYGMYATRREAEDAMMSILRKGFSGFVKQL